LSAPCACGEHDLIDITAAVADAASHNDNATLNLARDALYAGAGAGPLELPCGRFVFDSGTLAGARGLVVNARTGLFIDGDLIVTDQFQPELGANAELDLFVSGNLVLAPNANLGSSAHPGAVHIYAGGTGNFVFGGGASVAANLYAPHTSVYVTQAQALY